MQATIKHLSDTKVQLTLVADADQIKEAKKASLEALAKDLKLPGFRQGKVPLNLVEKNVNPSALQNEFLDRAMTMLYGSALDEHKLRPIAQPEVNITKFVPFEALEVTAEVSVLGEIKLPDYQKIRLAKKPVKIEAKDINEVLQQLTTREAERHDVDRAAKEGDQAVIDFAGVDAKTKEPIKGADGKDYPLALGSKTFIPGFEEELMGLKAGDTKTFVVTFPKDYGAKSLQNAKVEFTVTVKTVKEVVQPKVDDAFAAKVGPFKNVDELKDDIKKQLETEQQYQADRAYTDELLLKITKESKAAIPEQLVEEQIQRLVDEQKQNLMYRGMTWQEYLDSQEQTEEEFRKGLKEDAELRVKAGLVLSEIAEAEKVTVTPEELDIRMQILKGQYQDKQMQTELNKPASRREILNRMVSEKTIDKLVSYATAQA